MDLNTLIIKTLCYGTDPRKSIFEGASGEDVALFFFILLAVLLIVSLAAVIIGCL